MRKETLFLVRVRDRHWHSTGRWAWGPGHPPSREGSAGKDKARQGGPPLAHGILVSFDSDSCLSLRLQVSSSPQSCGHSLSPQTAGHCHGHRNWSSCACTCGTCACGGSGSSLPQSWGHCSPQSLWHSRRRRLQADTVLCSLEGTWERGTWEEAGTASGSAGRTSRQESDLEEHHRNIVERSLR